MRPTLQQPALNDNDAMNNNAANTAFAVVSPQQQQFISAAAWLLASMQTVHMSGWNIAR
jgi:hypothetical protein